MEGDFASSFRVRQFLILSTRGGISAFPGMGGLIREHMENIEEKHLEDQGREENGRLGIVALEVPPFDAAAVSQ